MVRTNARARGKNKIKKKYIYYKYARGDIKKNRKRGTPVYEVLTILRGSLCAVYVA